jgi:hypothetical protein
VGVRRSAHGPGQSCTAPHRLQIVTDASSRPVTAHLWPSTLQTRQTGVGRRTALKVAPIRTRAAARSTSVPAGQHPEQPIARRARARAPRPEASLPQPSARRRSFGQLAQKTTNLAARGRDPRWQAHVSNSRTLGLSEPTCTFDVSERTSARIHRSPAIQSRARSTGGGLQRILLRDMLRRGRTHVLEPVLCPRSGRRLRRGGVGGGRPRGG